MGTRRLWFGLVVVILAACAADDTADTDTAATPTTTSTPPATTTSASTTTSATTSTAVAPTASVPSDWAKFTESRFSYTIRRPPTWIVIPATEDWPGSGYPVPGGPSADRFAPSVDSPLYVFVSSTSSEIGLIARAELGRESASMCKFSNHRQVTVDGVTGVQDDMFCMDRDYLIEVTASNGTSFYLIDIFSAAPLTDDERVIFEQMLASIRLVS